MFIVYPITEIAEILDKGTTTIKSALNELDAAGLLERKREGFAAASHLYVKLPPVVQISVPMTDGKPTTNKTNINNLIESQTMRVSGEPPAPIYGRYGNISLSETEYAELQNDFPDRLERLIEEMSRYLAATGKTYQNYAAALRIWADNDKKGTAKTGIPDYSFKEGESL